MSSIAGAPPKGGGRISGVCRRLWREYLDSRLSVTRISLVYVWVGLFALFSLWVPDTFLSTSTWKSLAAEQAVTTILALAVVIALSSGVFDLSVAAILGAAAVLIAHLMVDLHVAPVPAAMLTLCGAVVVASISGISVVVLKVNSFIATLGVSSILAAFVSAVSNNQQIIGVPESFTDWATFEILGIQGAFWIAMAIAVAVWFVLEHRPAGRHMYATGGNPDAARLAGVRTNRIIFGTIVWAAIIAAVAGIVVTSRLGTGSPTIGPPYLLPAYAAAFLGSTQVKRGRFNVVGTLVAVYALATSVKGLQLAGAPFWLPELFNGVALVVAVAMSVRRRRLKSAVVPDVQVAPAAPPVTLRAAARESLEELRDKVQETVVLISVSDTGSHGRVIDVAEAEAPLRVVARVGEELANGCLPRGSLEEVQEVDDAGILTVFAPVATKGQLAAALAIRAPSRELTAKRRRAIADSAAAAAKAIAGRFEAERAPIGEAETGSRGLDRAHDQNE